MFPADNIVNMFIDIKFRRYFDTLRLQRASGDVMRLIHIACNSFMVGLLSICVVNRDLHLDFEVLQVSKFADSTSK